jgi:oligopeptide/dipeptide ABC transporter ATP-binding protein
MVICDEPTSGLDVSVTAMVINFMLDIQREFNLTYVWISHNIHVVKHVSDRLGIMYLGRIVEIGNTSEVIAKPVHPYTKALLSAVPTVNHNDKREKIILKGEIPSPITPPAGCTFHTRCFEGVLSKCKLNKPALTQVGKDHFVACYKCV